MNNSARLVLLAPIPFDRSSKANTVSKGCERKSGGKNQKVNLQFNNVVPFDVITGLRKVVVDVQDVNVAFFRAQVKPVALERQQHGRCSFVNQLLAIGHTRLLLSQQPKRKGTIFTIGYQSSLVH